MLGATAAKYRRVRLAARSFPASRALANFGIGTLERRCFRLNSPFVPAKSGDPALEAENWAPASAGANGVRFNARRFRPGSKRRPLPDRGRERALVEIIEL